MIADDLRQIVRGLILRTSEGVVRWQILPVTPSYQGGLRLNLPNATIMILPRGPKFEIILLNDEGDVAMSAEMGREDGDYKSVESMIALASRQARKVDQTIDALKQFIKSPSTGHGK